MKPISADAMRKTLLVSATAMFGVLAAILSEVKIGARFRRGVVADLRALCQFGSWDSNDCWSCEAKSASSRIGRKS
jgi:hypothetical protein